MKDEWLVLLFFFLECICESIGFLPFLGTASTTTVSLLCFGVRIPIKLSFKSFGLLFTFGYHALEEAYSF